MEEILTFQRLQEEAESDPSVRRMLTLVFIRVSFSAFFVSVLGPLASILYTVPRRSIAEPLSRKDILDPDAEA